MPVKKLSLFGVSVREKDRADSWEVNVVAGTRREARKKGVDAVEAEGLVKRTNIGRTIVCEKLAEVWQ